MLQALDDLLHSAEFEDDGWLTIRLARWREGDLLLEVEVQPGAAAPQQDWEIACRGVRRFQVRGEPAYGIDVHDEHVLLWPHRPVQEELFISSAPASASAVAGDLWSSHRELTADWIPAESFLNPDSALVQLQRVDAVRQELVGEIHAGNYRGHERQHDPVVVCHLKENQNRGRRSL